MSGPPPQVTGGSSPPGVIESATIGGPQLSSMLFLMQSTPSHQVTGTLLGFFEEDVVKTDYMGDVVTRRAVITGVKQDRREKAEATRNSSHEEATTPQRQILHIESPSNQHAPLGFFKLRRRTSHRLSFKDTQFLASGTMQPGGASFEAAQNLLLLMTESETETGLVGTHYSLYSRTPGSKKFCEIPLHISNLVSTGGDYQNLLRSFTRCPPLSAGLEAVAARQSRALEESSVAMTKAVSDSVEAAITELREATVSGKAMWTQVQENVTTIQAKKDNIERLKKELAAKKKQAARSHRQQVAETAGGAGPSPTSSDAAAAPPPATEEGGSVASGKKQDTMDQFFTA